MSNQLIDGAYVRNGLHQERVLFFPASAGRIDAVFTNSLLQLTTTCSAQGASKVEALRTLAEKMSDEDEYGKNGPSWAAMTREAANDLKLVSGEPGTRGMAHAMKLRKRLLGDPALQRVNRVARDIRAQIGL